MTQASSEYERSWVGPLNAGLFNQIRFPGIILTGDTQPILNYVDFTGCAIDLFYDTDTFSVDASGNMTAKRRRVNPSSIGLGQAAGVPPPQYVQCGTFDTTAISAAAAALVEASYVSNTVFDAYQTQASNTFATSAQVTTLISDITSSTGTSISSSLQNALDSLVGTYALQTSLEALQTKLDAEVSTLQAEKLGATGVTDLTDKLYYRKSVIDTALEFDSTTGPGTSSALSSFLTQTQAASTYVTQTALFAELVGLVTTSQLDTALAGITGTSTTSLSSLETLLQSTYATTAQLDAVNTALTTTLDGVTASMSSNTSQVSSNTTDILDIQTYIQGIPALIEAVYTTPTGSADPAPVYTRAAVDALVAGLATPAQLATLTTYNEQAFQQSQLAVTTADAVSSSLSNYIKSADLVSSLTTSIPTILDSAGNPLYLTTADTATIESDVVTTITAQLTTSYTPTASLVSYLTGTDAFLPASDLATIQTNLQAINTGYTTAQTQTYLQSLVSNLTATHVTSPFPSVLLCSFTVACDGTTNYLFPGCSMTPPVLGNSAGPVVLANTILSQYVSGSPSATSGVFGVSVQPTVTYIQIPLDDSVNNYSIEVSDDTTNALENVPLNTNTVPVTNARPRLLSTVRTQSGWTLFINKIQGGGYATTTEFAVGVSIYRLTVLDPVASYAP